MALEPYQPKQYRDELDRELDQKIDKAFERLPYKIWHVVIRVIIVFGAIWLAMQMLPMAFAFMTSGNVGGSIVAGLMQAATLFFFVGFQFFLMFYFMGRTRVYWLKPGETGIGFKDYKGNPEVLEAARRVVTLLRGAKEFKAMGGEVTRGVLLVGPPGTGKSYMAQAVATEAGVPFGYMSAPSLTSAFMGMGNMKVMNLYKKARKYAREYGACILFIDEIDAIGMARSSSMMGGSTAQTAPDGIGGAIRNVVGMGMGMGAGSGLLNELLIQMDPPPHEQTWWGKVLRFFGMRSGKRAEMPPVLTMGATNLAETLDAALLRPGRFDRKIQIDPPDSEGRKEVIEYYLSKVKHEPMPLDRMVSDTINFTPVAIKFVINEAVIHSHFDGRAAINYWDFTKARETHEWGLSQPIRNLPYEERRAVAYHEAGHAYVQAKLITRERIAKVTIVRHGRALGFVAPKPIDEHHLRNKQEMLDDIKVTLAARAAEEIFLGSGTEGVYSDMMQATRVAGSMAGLLAMDDSFFSYHAFGEGMSGSDIKPRVERILSKQYAEVKTMIESNKEAVTAIAEALILRNELTDLDINEILTRVEASYPYRDPNKPQERQPFGFNGTRALPDPTTISRRNGARIVRDGSSVPVAKQSPAVSDGPTAEHES